jgi:hypothetical protein
VARSRAEGIGGRQYSLVLRGHGWHAPFGRFASLYLPGANLFFEMASWW